jgi:hypothetical protein
MPTTHRITTISMMVMLSISAVAVSVCAQPAPEVAIDRMFRYESSAPSTQGRELLIDLKKWMGAYQRIRKEGSGYVAVFDSGSLPLDAKFKPNGSVESMTFGCPTSRSLSVSGAPTSVRKALSKCSGFKS